MNEIDRMQTAQVLGQNTGDVFGSANRSRRRFVIDAYAHVNPSERSPRLTYGCCLRGLSDSPACCESDAADSIPLLAQRHRERQHSLYTIKHFIGDGTLSAHREVVIAFWQR